MAPVNALRRPNTLEPEWRLPHISGPYLLRYAQEAGWREDHRRTANGDQARIAVTNALGAKPSVDFCGYWQRHKVQA